MSRNHIWLTAVMIIALMTAFLSNDLYLPAMPVLKLAFHTSANLMQMTEGAWFAGSMTLQLLVGPLSDTYGRKPTLMAALIILIVGSLICAWATNINIFIAGRFVQGMASSGIMAVSFAAVHESAPTEREATKMLAMVSMITTAAPISGPLIGGYLAEYFSWQMTFYLVCWLAIFSIISAYHLLPQTDIRQSRMDWRKQLNNYMDLLNNHRYITAVASYACLFFAIGVFLSGLPFVMVDILGFSISQVGYALIPLLVIYMAATGLTGHLTGFARPTTIIFSALTVATTAMLAFTAISLHWQGSVTLLITCMAGFYLGFGFGGPHLNNIPLACATETNKGSSSALLTMSMMLGSTLGSCAMGMLYNHQLWSLALLLTAAVMVSLASYGVYYAKLNQSAKQSHIQSHTRADPASD